MVLVIHILLNLSYPKFEEKESEFQIWRDLFSDLKPLQNGEGTLNAVEYIRPTTEYLKQSKIRNGLENFVTIKSTKKQDEIILPKIKDINLEEPTLRNKGIIKKDNINIKYDENKIQNEKQKKNEENEKNEKNR
jgi:hypothetical protein